jgi:DNA-binding response OmpR family regulator
LKKILVVDDEDNIRLLYQEELRDAGYEVSLAKNAEEALKIVEEDPPDLITLDVKLPGMSGFDFLKELKANKKNIRSSNSGHRKPTWLNRQTSGN